MNRPPIMWILVIGSIATMALAENATERREREIAELREAVLNAKTAPAAGEAFEKYFKRVSPTWPHGLVWLQNDPNTSIALQAAFHHKVVLDPIWEKNRGRAGPGCLTTTDAQRFFGFFEGRTRLKLPEWWQRGSQEDRFPSINEREQHFEKFTRIPEELNVSWHLSFPHDVQVERAKDGLKLTSRKEKESVLLGKNLLDQMQEKAAFGLGECQLHFFKRKVFFAFFDALGTTSPLFCVDQTTGKLDWQSEIWALGKLESSSTGFWSFRMELGFPDDQVVIFGAGNFGSFAESFSQKDGQVRFRFSTNYWQMWNEK